MLVIYKCLLCQMKKTFLILIAFSAAFFSFAQHDSTLAPPYKRFPTVPSFNLLMVDSISYYTKADLPQNKAILIILFDPNCDHCKHETEEIVKNIDNFRNVQIVMVTNAVFCGFENFLSKLSAQ